jgi:hypothetical protein
VRERRGELLLPPRLNPDWNVDIAFVLLVQNIIFSLPGGNKSFVDL